MNEPQFRPRRIYHALTADDISSHTPPFTYAWTHARARAAWQGPGEFGYYPLIDRSGGGGKAGPARDPYYMQVCVMCASKGRLLSPCVRAVGG